MIETLGKHAKTAAFELAKYATLEKNQFLQQLAQALVDNTDGIISENAKDLAKLGKEVEKKVLAEALKLVFNDKVFIDENKTVIFE